jgi:methionine-rich copper-binding protein CopC
MIASGAIILNPENASLRGRVAAVAIHLFSGKSSKKDGLLRRCAPRNDVANKLRQALPCMICLQRLIPAVMVAMLLGIAPAFAHAFLVKSNPSVGSTVTTAPADLVLTFTEGLEIPFCSVAVTDGMGMNDAAGKPQPVPGHPEQMMVALNISMPGKILVTWHAVSVDTHKTQGSFSFTVAP